MRKLTLEDIDDIIVGSTFMGAGGGGSPVHGRMLVDDLRSKGVKEIALIDPEEMGPEEYAVMVAGIGAPRAFKEKKFGKEAVFAFETIRNVHNIGGKTIKYLMAGELGGFNTVVPLYVAALTNTPVIDADGNGRAVPELATGLYPAYNIPPHPLVLANGKGDRVIAYLNNPMDHEAAETIARHLAIAWGMLAAFATWVVNRDQIINNLAPKTISLCERVGKIFKEVKALGAGLKKLSEELSVAVKAKELFVGRISRLETRTVEGFDFGRTTLEGLGDYSGREFFIDFKNENMIAWRAENEPAAMVPDLISLVDIERLEPVTNADTKEGMKIAVYGVPASANWRRSEKAIGCWRHILERLGYKGEYIPL